MHTVTVQVSQARPGIRPDDIFATFLDLAAMPARTDTVLAVSVDPTPDTHGESGSVSSGSVSRWQVRFGAGVLQWTERDVVDPVARQMAFSVLDGDIPEFSGRWTVTEADGCVMAGFEARFDFGMPELADALGPVAGRALVHAVLDILHGVLGPGALVVQAAHGRMELVG